MTFQKKFEIEVGSVAEPTGEKDPGGNCGSYFFPPMNTVMRGRATASIYSSHDMSERMRSFFRKFRVIPGMRIWVDFRAADSSKGIIATYGAYDGLDDKAYDNDRKRILRFISQEFEGGNEVETAKSTEGHLTTSDKAKDFLYWMRRAVDAGYAFVPDAKSNLPAMEAIKKMPGRRMVPGYNNTSDKETRQILSEYDHYVEPKGA